MRESLYDYCTRTRRQALLEEWDVEGNGALTPLALSHGSRQKVWWRCGAGHRWQAAVYTRTGAESGCPYCAGKRPWPGFNDLASQEPALAAQWHPEDTAHARIYDRLLEMCSPLCFTGENLRKAAAQGKMEQLKRLLAGKEICL